MAWTTITVQEETLDRFRELKEGLNDGQPDCPDHSNESFLQSLMDEWEADPEADNDECNVEAITEHLDETLSVPAPDLPAGDAGLDYDDVKNACAAAIREELEEGMGR